MDGGFSVFPICPCFLRWLALTAISPDFVDNLKACKALFSFLLFRHWLVDKLPSFPNLNNLRAKVVSQRADNVCDDLQGENDVLNFRNFKQCGQ